MQKDKTEEEEMEQLNQENKFSLAMKFFTCFMYDNEPLLQKLMGIGGIDTLQ